MTDISIDHVHIKSAAPEASAQFYTEAFGARIVDRKPVNGGERIILDLGGVTFFIENHRPDASEAHQMPSRGLEHFGLRVANLDAMVERLRAMNVVFTTEPTSPNPGLKIAFLKGPDGEYIELVERSA